MFTKILIANRGAIAVRLIRTLRRMGITSVVVYAECDAESLHVRLADEAWSLGDGPAASTYLDVDKLFAIAESSGAEAIHPGYGFLSENATFVRRCEQQGLIFIGPTPAQMEAFGLKHTARQLAQQAGVPLLPGSGLLQNLAEARQAAQSIGYPVMLKSTAGGGGIGMQCCHNDAELSAAFDSVRRLGANNFSDDGVFLEKFITNARHIEVQIIADGKGDALAIGERDCSSQRRNQKVVEECPAPNLLPGLAENLQQTAQRLLASVSYRNAGTVEYIVDADSGNFYFLEVNTRLQVEHGVTEEVFGIDLVEWMCRLAADITLTLDGLRQQMEARGHAIQVRIYGEDPYRNFQPCAGLLSEVSFPAGEGVRIDSWIESGIEVPPYFDPMLAKVIVHATDRKEALAKMQKVLAEIRLYGSMTNLDYLRHLLQAPQLLNGLMTTRALNDFNYQPARIDVITPGTQSTLQDSAGRRGYWHIGVPPSGAFDKYSFALANRLLENPEDAAGLEIAVHGPSLRFSVARQIVICGAVIVASLDGEALVAGKIINVAAGQTLSLGKVAEQGARAYLCVRGGIDCPHYLGSRASFTLGQFGGHNGRALRAGDVLNLDTSITNCPVTTVGQELWPKITNNWTLRVIYGPHGAPEFFTAEDIETFFATNWEVHYNSSRTGIRLIGPKPQWARKDGGEAGLHPSNIHDNAYAFGTVDFTGDMPVILGPDGPSLGGFVCPATVIQADLWQLGQLRAGDKIRFVAVDLATAVSLEARQKRQLESLQFEEEASVPWSTDVLAKPVLKSPILRHLPASQYGDDIVIRAAGDHFVLVEYGDVILDIRLRFRAHALMQYLQQHPFVGQLDLTPGIRSLQVHFDSQQISHDHLLDYLERAESELTHQLDSLKVPSRIIHLPLSWDDIACRQAIEKYQQSVRKDAPWCPSNIEFIRRINGLNSIEEIKAIVFSASYLVMGLGDVYLGAPVATPIDPRHRLVTTKYNPARTWTAENSVGIGGSYLCVYGMEGPGGYQFIGRTLQMWNRYRKTREFTRPWLLNFFDQIRFFPVSHEELQQIRRDFPLGQYPLRIEPSNFSLTDYQQFITNEEPSIAAFREQRNEAFAAELAHWHASGQFNYTAAEQLINETTQDYPEDSVIVSAPVSGSLWQSLVDVGAEVAVGDELLVLESMKMEIPVQATCAGRVSQILVRDGSRINAGQPLMLLTVLTEEER